MNGFQHLYMELDDLSLLKQLVQLYLEQQIDGGGRSTAAIGVLIWTPEVSQKVKLPWVIRSVPALFPLMLVDHELLTHSDPERKPWYHLAGEPTYVLKPSRDYSAISQLFHQLDHYLRLHATDWEEAWGQVPVPDIDGSLEEGFTLSAGCFEGPLVIGRRYMEYHK